MRRLLLLAGLVGASACASSAGAADVLFIRGGGYGHGIGMSQYGAYGYALHGKDYRFILAHYYRGTTLGQSTRAQTVRVLLGTGSARVQPAPPGRAPSSSIPASTYASCAQRRRLAGR